MYARFWWRDNEDGRAAYYVREKPRERVYVDVVLEPHDQLVSNELTLRVWSPQTSAHAAERILEPPELDSAGRPQPLKRMRFHFPISSGGPWPFEIATELLPAAVAGAAAPEPQRLDGSLTVVPTHSRTAARWLAVGALVCWLYALWVVNMTAAEEPLLKLAANGATLMGGAGAPLLQRSRLPRLGFFLDWRVPTIALTLMLALFVLARSMAWVVWVDNRTGTDLELAQGSVPSGQRVLLLDTQAAVHEQLAELGSNYCADRKDCHFPKQKPFQRFWERLVFFPPHVEVGCRKLGVLPAEAPDLLADDACSFETAQLQIQAESASHPALQAILGARQWAGTAAKQRLRLAVPRTQTAALLQSKGPWDLANALGEFVFAEVKPASSSFALRFAGHDIVREVEAPAGPGLILTPAKLDATGVATLHAQVVRHDNPEEMASLTCTVPAAVNEPLTVLVPRPRPSAHLADLMIIDGSLTVSHWHAQKPQLTPLPLACRSRRSNELLTDEMPDQVVLVLSSAWYPTQRWRFHFPSPIPAQFTIYSGPDRVLGTLECKLPRQTPDGVEIGPVAIASPDRKPVRRMQVWQGHSVGDPSSVWEVSDAAPAYLALWPWACAEGSARAPRDGEEPAAPAVVVDGRRGKLLSDGIVFDARVQQRCRIVKSDLRILQSFEGHVCTEDRDMRRWLREHRRHERRLEGCNDASVFCEPR